MSCIIEMNNVCFSAQGFKLVHDISIPFEEGTTTALIGPSGGGKSTVLKLAAGLFPPDEGEVLYKGKDIARMGRQENLSFRRETAGVFQDSALWANQDLYQILELPLRVHSPGMPHDQREKKIKEVVAKVGYRKALRIRPAGLSMGEQKLIAFARAMICDPQLLFLDEWTESLDQSAAQRLIALVRKFKDEGVSIILVTHNIQIIRTLADRAFVIRDGRISFKLSKEQIASDTDLSSYIEGEAS
jgi:ABC-type multidrug transport system ATPase subunit